MEVEEMDSQEFMTLGSSLVILGIIFSGDRLIGYSFIGVGVLLSIISIVKSKGAAKKQTNGTGGV